MPAKTLDIRTGKLSDLIPDANNANKGTARGLALLDKSLRQNGAGRSILIDKNGRIIAGNKTTDRAADIGLSDVIIVQTDGSKLVAVQRTDLDLETDPQARELAYFDNRVAELDLDWNIEQLLADIEAGVNLDPLFNEDDLAVMLEQAATDMIGGYGQEPPPLEEPIIDKAEELQKKWQVQPGQIYQIGPHFIICGDCREPETWQRLLGAAKVDKVNGVFTSPPYAEQRKAQYGGVPVGEYVQWWEAVQGNVRAALAGDGSFFVNIKPHCEDGQRVLYVFDLVLAMVRAWGWRFVEEFCWVRNGVPKSISERFRNAFEPVYHFAGEELLKMRPDSVKTEPSDVTIKRLDFAVRSGEVDEGRNYSKGGFSRDWATTQ